jgi:hypothetical protein
MTPSTVYKHHERIRADHPYAPAFYARRAENAWRDAVRRGDTRGQHETHKAYVEATGRVLGASLRSEALSSV